MYLDLRSPRRLARQRLRDALAAVRTRWSATLLIAALGALIAGLAGAATGQWVGWSTAGPLPTNDDAAAIARLALGEPAPLPERRDHIFGYGSDGAYGPGYVRFTVPADAVSSAFAWQAKDVRVRLATAGWRIDRADLGGPADPAAADRRVAKAKAGGQFDPAEPPGLVFVADKGPWRVRYSAVGTDRVHLDIVREQPMWVLPAGALGALLGTALGWIVGGWAARRWRRLVGRPRRLGRGLAALGGAALVPALVLVAAQQIDGYADLARPQIPLWTAVMHPVVQPPAVLAAVALLTALAVVGLGPARPRGGRRLG